MLELVFVILLALDGAEKADDAVLVVKDADNLSATLDLLVRPFQRIGAVKFDPVLFGQAHAGQHIMLGLVHTDSKLRPAGAQLVHDLNSDPRRGGMIALKGDQVDGGGDHGVLAFGLIGQRIAYEVGAATLPHRSEDAGCRCLEAFRRIPDDQLDAL